MKFSAELLHFEDSRVYGRHFIVPDDVVAAMTEGRDDRRVIIQINGHEDMHAGMMPKKSYHYILLNKENCRSLGLNLGDGFEVEIRPDDSRYGMPMPRELEEYLLQDDHFSRYFESLTPGKQRNLIHIVSKLKSTDKRIEKAHIIAQHLIRQRGQLDFKVLMQDFKRGI